MKSVRSALAVLALAALGAAAPSERIIGGSYATDGDYPEMVSVYRDPLVGETRHICGGIIVNDNHVLTTATCVQDEGTLYLNVMAAGANLDAAAGYEEFRSVNEIFIHEAYDATTKVNDLAILRISHNFVFVTGLVTPAVLPLTGTPEPATGTILTAVGWGQNGAVTVVPETGYSPFLSMGFHKHNTGSAPLVYVGRLSGDMQVQQKAVDLPYLSQEECSVVFGMFVQANEGCLQSSEEAGVCDGDEGGVVLDADGTAVAMVSWHVNCNEFPAVVTRLAPYYEWIVGHFES